MSPRITFCLATPDVLSRRRGRLPCQPMNTTAHLAATNGSRNSESSSHRSIPARLAKKSRRDALSLPAISSSKVAAGTQTSIPSPQKKLTRARAVLPPRIAPAPPPPVTLAARQPPAARQTPPAPGPAPSRRPSPRPARPLPPLRAEPFANPVTAHKAWPRTPQPSHAAAMQGPW